MIDAIDHKAARAVLIEDPPLGALPKRLLQLFGEAFVQLVQMAIAIDGKVVLGVRHVASRSWDELRVRARTMVSRI